MPMATMAEFLLHIVAIELERKGSTAPSRRLVRTPQHEVDRFMQARRQMRRDVGNYV